MTTYPNRILNYDQQNNMKTQKDLFLLASVFITGTAVLVIEILATRILSPYYGNTIYTTSSVIGTVLAALSLGYYFGGKFADRHPDQRIFYGIITISGLLIIIMQITGKTILPLMGVMFSIVSGPLIASMALFFVPAFCLGILSPFAIKLYEKGNETIGSKAGEVFFWSTLGSITGTLLAGFVLIPYLGINAIVLSTGALLGIWGLLGILFSHQKNRGGVLLTMASILVASLIAWQNSQGVTAQTLYEQDGVYEKIKIMEGQWSDPSRTPTAVGGEQPVRFLFQDRSYSAAMYLNSPELVYDYTKYYALYKLFKPEATTSLVMGGGAYSIPKALLNDSLAMQVDVAEIEPRLFSLAKQYFNVIESPRLTNHIQDGRQLLKLNDKHYDAIISDVYYSLFSVPIHFTTKEFFSLAKSRLSENGVFVGNYAGYLQGEQPSFIGSEITTFKEVFPNSYFFAVNSPTSEKGQNIIFLGINGEKRIDFDSNLVKNNPDPILRNLANKNITLSSLDLANNFQITDDYAPVEHLISKIIDQWH